MVEITASPETLMRQASMTADEYLNKAVTAIDRVLGDGYAKQHPELIAEFMRTAAADFNTAITAQAVQSAGSEIAEAIRSTK
jgi:hypothetical protein